MATPSPHQPDKITRIHALCFLYFSFAIDSDQELSDTEASIIAEKLTEWSSGTREEVAQYINETMAWIKGYERDEQRVEQLIQLLTWLSDLSMENKRAILTDIKSIALADQKVTDGEKSLYAAVAKGLGLTKP